MLVIAKHSKLEFVEKVDKVLNRLFEKFAWATHVKLSMYAEISMNYHMGIRLEMQTFQHDFWFDSSNISDHYAEEIAHSIFGYIIAEYAHEIVKESIATYRHSGMKTLEELAEDIELQQVPF